MYPKKDFFRYSGNGQSQLGSKTRVLLCQSWYDRDEGRPDAKKFLIYRLNWPNYGLALLATLAKEAGYPVEILDAEAELVMNGKGDSDYILKYRIPQLVSNFRPDIVGISCISARWPQAYRMACAFDLERKKGNNFKLILGGFHPTSCVEEVFQQAPFIDWVHIGDSEESFMNVLEGKNPKSLSGIAWKEQDTIQQSPPQTVQLDSLPFPRWDLLNLAYYFCHSEVSYLGKALRVFPLFSNRGCIYRCAFCTFFKYQAFQRHSARYVGDYIEYLLRNYQVDALYPYDSFISGQHLHQICETMLERGINKRIVWGCALRANEVKKEDILFLKRTNCCMAFYGFESGSDRILARMNKGATVEDGLRVVQHHHEFRLPFSAMMIFGYPQEELQDVQLTKQFLKNCRPYGVCINVFVPMPGSKVFDELRRQGKIQINRPDDYGRYSSYGVGDHINFTAMDDETYKLEYERLIRLSEALRLNTKRDWALRDFADVSKLPYTSDKAAPLKAYMMRRNFGAIELGKQDLSGAADALLYLERIDYRCRSHPLAKLLPKGFLYLALLVMLDIYVSLPQASRKYLPSLERILVVLSFHL